MTEIYLSVVIPCYNEERNIRLGALENVSSYLNRQKYNWEVILVDDGSTDDSHKLLLKFVKDKKKFKLLRKKHQGKAAAVITGVLKSQGKIILFTDLDQAAPLSEVEKLLHYFNKGFQIVIGSRNSIRLGAPLLRKAMAKGFMVARNLILNLGIKDTQCGFKAFQRNAALKIFPKLKVFNLHRHASGSTVTAGFDIELLYIAKLLDFKIAEVPVEWHYQETRHINPVKDSLESLLDLVKIRINSLTGQYQAV
ncbi:hypothetical protein A2W14_03925 [Candidatus Gottesmanbacteria bacterium RBG_16_37_8]|uniref:Glycosyltransferase 2-like domain-containing protein n=1 Tax=Candidatus Gottesmanbacteria bacterium RBG_16_37_8 TaxID=1798371 RepID=A0A1F5YQZ9_9BACT|nr:MAG: hypothetical protein A2W14_03925 [Candidatus Gottesmanbacteria bacterium RBG_16_37_8]